jgi:chitinase
MTEFRNELTTLSGTTGKTYQLVADLAAGASTPGAGVDSGNDGGYDTIDIPGLSAQLDYLNVDGYNYAGDWSLATDEASPLYDDSLDTANALYPNDSIDYTVKYYLGKGAPAAKYASLWCGLDGWPDLHEQRHVPDRDRTCSSSQC